MIRRPPRSTRTAHSFPTRRSSDLVQSVSLAEQGLIGPAVRWLLDDHMPAERSEEHTSELQSLMRTSYAVFCLKKKTDFNELHTLVTANHRNQKTQDSFPHDTHITDPILSNSQIHQLHFLTR